MSTSMANVGLASAASANTTSQYALPIVDIAGYGLSAERSEKITSEIRKACLDKGFFYCIGHGMNPDLMSRVFSESREFFSRPMVEKMTMDRAKSAANRGYETLRGQTLEPGTPPDLKEGFYIGEEIAPTDPRCGRYFNFGPNVWPEDGERFRCTMTEYYSAARCLAEHILELIRESLEMPVGFFDELYQSPLSILRLLHYPPQQANSLPDEKGCGAHTDFGAMTILLQDATGGLQVWEHEKARWIDAVPMPGAFIINLGDLIGRWTNDLYRSTLHRVVNKSGVDRYSVPFFYSGNPEYTVGCIPTCLAEGETPRYPSVTVDQHIRNRYKQSYDSV